MTCVDALPQNGQARRGDLTLNTKHAQGPVTMSALAT